MRTAITIDGCDPTSMNLQAAGSHIVQLASGTIYVFLTRLLGTTDIAWTKSLDGGLTWSSLTNIYTTNTVTQFSLWYDRWSGLSSDYIHLCYVDTTGDDVLYRRFDPSNDSLGTQTTVYGGSTTATSEDAWLTISVSESGYIYVAYSIDALAEYGFSYSTDNGANWNSAANAPQEATGDKYILVPSFGGTSNDIMCIFHDTSANELSRKIFSYSGGTWAETSISTGITKGTYSSVGNGHFKAISDGSSVWVAGWTDYGNSKELKFWEVTSSAITAKTSVITSSSSGGGYQYGIAITKCGSSLYVYYHGKSGLSDYYTQQAPNHAPICYKMSSDAGSSWGGETIDCPLSIYCLDGIESSQISYGLPVYGAVWNAGFSTRGVYNIYSPYKSPSVK